MPKTETGGWFAVLRLDSSAAIARRSFSVFHRKVAPWKVEGVVQSHSRKSLKRYRYRTEYVTKRWDLKNYKISNRRTILISLSPFRRGFWLMGNSVQEVRHSEKFQIEAKTFPRQRQELTAPLTAKSRHPKMKFVRVPHFVFGISYISTPPPPPALPSTRITF